MKKTFTITVHCLVKNEENFVGYGVRSVIDYVDKVIIFDTGSTDKTVDIIQDLARQYPDKIIFLKKDECDWIKHSAYKQEMLEMTKTDWFMILDGDEVWTKRGIEEAVEAINLSGDVKDCLSTDCYLCMGDIFHDHNRKLIARINGVKNLFSARFFKVYPGEMRWIFNDKRSDEDFVRNGKLVCDNSETNIIIKNKMWHMTHLRRSSFDDNIFSSNNSVATRKSKRRSTYFIVGEKIKEELPEVFDVEFRKASKLSFLMSFINFWPYFFRKLPDGFKKIFVNYGK